MIQFATLQILADAIESLSEQQRWNTLRDRIFGLY